MRKRIISVVLAVMMVVLSGSVPAEAKAGSKAGKKQIRLNKSSAVVENGKTVRLKLNNAKKKVAWSSSNKYTASVDKKGKVTGKRLGNVTITAKCQGKKYRCKVRVCSNIDADKITMTYANSVFTEDLYKKVDHIDGGNCGVLVTVKDKKAVKAIYSCLAALKLKEVQNPELLYGHIECDLVLQSGEVISVTLNRYVSVNGMHYEVENLSVLTELGKLIEDNRDWGDC